MVHPKGQLHFPLLLPRQGIVLLNSAGYPVRMNTELELKGGSWLLVVGPRTVLPTLLRLTARQAESEPVRVVDGGNIYNVYPVARTVRGQPEVLERIRLSRAFSCYQMLAMLEALSCEPSAHLPQPSLPGGSRGIVILDFLRTFYDESVKAGERKRLLMQCLEHLDRLVARPGKGTPSQQPGALVRVHPPKVPSPVARELLEMLTHAAKDIYRVETPAPPPIPLRLF
jgi:hypothetical protein